MKRFYENLLGEFDERRERRALADNLPKAVALREAKQGLRSRSAAQVRKLVERSNESDWIEWLRTNLFNDQELVVEVTDEGVISFRKQQADSSDYGPSKYEMRLAGPRSPVTRLSRNSGWAFLTQLIEHAQHLTR